MNLWIIPALIINSWELVLCWCLEPGAVKDAGFRFEGLLIHIAHVRKATENDRKLTEAYRN